jgi:UDPglucose 6-dehydrogenase
MKIAIAGTGYVGLVTAVVLADIGHNVTCVDIDSSKIDMLKRGECPIFEQGLPELMEKNRFRLNFTTEYSSAYSDADAIFIAVGTPEKIDGSANLSYVYEVAGQIAETIRRDCIVVVKSTVPIGTNDRIEQHIKKSLKHEVFVEVVSNPEFLSQGTALRDLLHGSRIVVGTQSEKARLIMAELYENMQQPIVYTNRRSAEMIKYASNDFLALKISFINEIANLCEVLGADVEDVARGMGLDPRIGEKFLREGIGYGGSCFPKDTKALQYLARQHGYELRTVKAAIDVNKDQKTMLFKKACRRLITFNGLKVAVLGLTFKPGTDDLREAPSLDNVPLLLEQGADVFAYDPAGMDNFKKIYPPGSRGRGTITYPDSIEEALRGAHVCFILTEWREIRDVKPETYKKLMKAPLVYDGRNIYRVQDMKSAGVEYYSIGRESVDRAAAGLGVKNKTKESVINYELVSV